MVKAATFPEISKDELLGAIRQGVCDAVWRMITNATDTPCHDFYDAIKDGVSDAVANLDSAA